MTQPSRHRIAILGGGCGGLSTAYWLSASEELRKRYLITVYTTGWRLGGKGASGRDADQHERILEHGLHMMMGFYDVVFRTLRDCWAELAPGPDSAFRTWTEAFEPQREVTLWLRPSQTDASAPPQPWNLHLPKLPGEPGDGPLLLPPETDYLHEAISRLLHHLSDELLPAMEPHVAAPAAQAHPVSHLRKALDEALQNLENLASATVRTMLILLLEGVQKVFASLVAPSSQRAPVSLERYKLYIVFELALACAIGLLKDILPHGAQGYSRIDDQDFKDWLVAHGASREAAESAPIMCLYDLAFAFPGGASGKPADGRAAAGAFLSLLLRMSLTYRNAPIWKMCAGMGDVIFTPLYQVLRRRGVRFEFFHRVDALRLSADGHHVERIELSEQARLLQSPYRPTRSVRFVNGRSWDCWPSTPQWDQLEDGEALRKSGVDFEDPWTLNRAGQKTLQRDTDFDDVVLAIPPDASAPLTQDLRARPRWAAMLDNASSVATLSCQLWLQPDLHQLGWIGGETVATDDDGDLQSWGEMDQVLDAEAWPPEARPHACAYFCGTFTADPPPPIGTNAPDYVPSQNEKVRRLSRDWLGSHVAAMWPHACNAQGEFDWTLVASGYYRGNVQGSERYALSLPGSLRYRLDPADSGYTNLYLAGDWTLNSINGGCAEAAFESGLRAALGIRGEPLPAKL